MLETTDGAGPHRSTRARRVVGRCRAPARHPHQSRRRLATRIRRRLDQPRRRDKQTAPTLTKGIRTVGKSESARARRPRAQRTGDRAHRSARSQARQIPATRRAPRVPRRAVIMWNSPATKALHSRRKPGPAGRSSTQSCEGHTTRYGEFHINGSVGGLGKRTITLNGGAPQPDPTRRRR
jgi:hypothetical protein